LRIDDVNTTVFRGDFKAILAFEYFEL